MPTIEVNKKEIVIEHKQNLIGKKRNSKLYAFDLFRKDKNL